MRISFKIFRHPLHFFIFKYNKNYDPMIKFKYNYEKGEKTQQIFIKTSITSIIGYNIYDQLKRNVQNQQPQESGAIGKFSPNLPTYTEEEIAKHNTKEYGIWITYKEGVYDITKFVEEHPGGDQILMAAGSSVEPFWKLYAVHHNLHVLEILETFRIGNISYTKLINEENEDPYHNDPKRHSALKSTSVKPFNAETSLSVLCEKFITPNDLFYVRNHLPVPEIDTATYELEVEIEGKQPVHTLSYDKIKSLPQHTITATIMCAGNRRSEMTKVKMVKGLNWGAAAIGNATWTGARLSDVLKAVGVEEAIETTELKHVQFEGFDHDPTSKNYGASIPIWRALDRRADVILAYEMNGVPIPRDHGFPIRVIVPGVVGARNVKWLGKIVVSKNESDSHWQQNDYKGFSPSTDWDTVDFTKSPAIQELPVISAICVPVEGDTVQLQKSSTDDDNGYVLVKGYAWSGGGQKIVRVDVTADSGTTWHVANLDFQDDAAEPPQHWAWTLWSVKIPVEKNTKNLEIWAKAVDSCYNTQPESFKNIWNLRGVLSNAYHKISIVIEQ